MQVKETVLHAHCYAIGLYIKVGFKARGERFKEAGIEHIELYLDNAMIH